MFRRPYSCNQFEVSTPELPNWPISLHHVSYDKFVKDINRAQSQQPCVLPLIQRVPGVREALNKFEF
jgi:hypothetical protein